MCHYKHLTLIEREMILFFVAQRYTVSKIARELGRDKSTVSRELKRNPGRIYSPVKAQAAYVKRRRVCRRYKKLSNVRLFEYVQDKFLNHQWSPEEIAGRLSLEKNHCVISYNTIYRAIYAGMFDLAGKSLNGRSAVRHLRFKGKPRRSKGHVECRGKIVISNDINSRPIGAANRSRRGHWEGDTVIGKKGRSCIVTLTDRKSRFLAGGKATAKTADAVNSVIIKALKGKPLRSITPDRGKEFAKHAEVSRELNMVKFYFPPAHQPWQRGTNENTNRLLREYFPKGKDINNLSDEYIQEKIDELNLRPRKCLGYRTPFEAFYSKVLHLA